MATIAFVVLVVPFAIGVVDAFSCYVNIPDCTSANPDCDLLETWTYCAAMYCAQHPDQASALRQQCVDSLPYSCPNLGCNLSCDLLNDCESFGNGGDGLETKWVIIIALGSALAGVLVSIGLALLGAWRKRTAQTYETLN
nr:hypothetical protein [Pandoravirus belohorizontensis]